MSLLHTFLITTPQSTTQATKVRLFLLHVTFGVFLFAAWAEFSKLYEGSCEWSNTFFSWSGPFATAFVAARTFVRICRNRPLVNKGLLFTSLSIHEPPFSYPVGCCLFQRFADTSMLEACVWALTLWTKRTPRRCTTLRICPWIPADGCARI